MQTVAELMVPVEGYTVVADTDSLLAAIEALEAASAGMPDDPSRPRDRAVLVRRADGRILGKLSMWDLLAGLDPRQGHPVDPLSMVETFGLWSHALLRNAPDAARQMTAGALLRRAQEHEDERIDAGASMDQAVNQLIRGRYLSLLVTRNSQIVGILRLSDVFRTVSGLLRRSPAPA